MIKRLKSILFLVSERKIEEAEEEIHALDPKDSDLQETLLRLLHNRQFLDLENIILQHLHHISIPVPSEPLLGGLRTSLSLMSTRLSVALNKKAEIQRQINAFRLRHNSELGMLIGDILRLQLDLFNLRQKNDARFRKAYKQAQKDYSSFENQKKHISREKPIHQISKEEHNRLRKLYREASKRCHPDMVLPEMREEARQWFIELNNAYLYNDIRKVEEIYEVLSRNLFTQTLRDEKSEAAMLKARIKRLEVEIMKVEKEIKDLTSSPVYKTLRQIDDFDSYFSELKEKLEKEYKALKIEYEQESAKERL